MKVITIVVVLFITGIFNPFKYNPPFYNTLNTIEYCDSTPVLNSSIIDFVKKNLKKKVGQGECWDLAAVPLNQLGASWDKMYQFGKVVDYQSDCIYPGDIIQFEGVQLKYKEGNVTHNIFMDHHTAIVYQVLGIGTYKIAHQNTDVEGKKVSIANLNLANIIKGTFTIYRPVKE